MPQPARVLEILPHVGEQTTAPAIALGRAPLLQMNRQNLTDPTDLFWSSSTKVSPDGKALRWWLDINLGPSQGAQTYSGHRD